ncbi:MAG: DUF547 domain-containing protein [Deltaproteobacteria bacterium]|nr:DUF547 domain-containing protein [Deltaproteobacteria bacterium]
MKLLVLALVFVLSLFQGAFPNKALGFDHRHLAFNEILKRSVFEEENTSWVHYQRLKEEPVSLEAYLSSLENVSLKEFEGFPKNEQIAFLINAYNAYTLKRIKDNYPVRSIRDLGGFFLSPWKVRFFYLFGEKRNLEFIEKKLLSIGGSRVVFALTTASIGSPSLSRVAYRADELERQLDAARKAFLSDHEKNFYDSAENRLNLSGIFKWFKEDFEREKGSLKAYVTPLIAQDQKERDEIIASNNDIFYTEYEWELNEYPIKIK